MLPSGSFRSLLESLSQSFVASCMADGVQKGDYDAAVRSLCAALHVELSQQYQQSEAALDEAANGVMFIMILIIFFVLWIMLDGMRYRRYARHGHSDGGVPSHLLGTPSPALSTPAPFGRPEAPAGRAETAL